MLPRHPRQYTPSSVPNPSLGPGVLDILVRPRIDVCSISAFTIRGFFLDFFALLRYLVEEMMIWTRDLAFTLPYDSSLCNPLLFVIALRPPQFRLRLLWGKGKKRRRGFCFRVRLRFGFKLERFFVLPPPKSELVPFVVPDALREPELLDVFTCYCTRVGPNGYTICTIQMCLEDTLILFADLSRELSVRA